MKIAEFVDANGTSPYGPAGPQPAPSTSSSSADDAREALLLQSLIDKQYRQKLRELRRSMTPQALRELQESVPPEQRPQLQLIVEDLLSMGQEVATASWEEEELSEEEQLLLYTRLQQSVHLPDDFARCGGGAQSWGGAL